MPLLACADGLVRDWRTWRVFCWLRGLIAQRLVKTRPRRTHELATESRAGISTKTRCQRCGSRPVRVCQATPSSRRHAASVVPAKRRDTRRGRKTNEHDIIGYDADWSSVQAGRDCGSHRILASDLAGMITGTEYLIDGGTMPMAQRRNDGLVTGRGPARS